MTASWKAEYQGQEIDIDPMTLNMAAWEQIEQRAGISGLNEMLQALFAFKPGAWKALYWAGCAREGDPGPYGDFAGPTYVQVLSHRERLVEFGEQVEAMMTEPEGKADASPPETAG